MRAYCEALVRTKGRKIEAAEAAGVTYRTVTSWRANPAFVAMEKTAYRTAMEHARAAAIRRALEGNVTYKFTKDGDPIYHPTLCRCGHHDEAHTTDEMWPEVPAEPSVVIPGTRGKPDRRMPATEYQPPRPKDVRVARSSPCGACSCARWRAAPYTETVFSDKLLEMLLKAGFPDEFAERRVTETRGFWDRIDVGSLPPELIGALADGARLEEIVVRLLVAGREVPLLAAGPPMIGVDAPNGEVGEGGGVVGQGSEGNATT